ncbi:MAG: D-alanine--D-alanine ligase [Clostridia bacterium]|nr:D-alanine--D-alanine ligase [Clostridia bacterium]
MNITVLAGGLSHERDVSMSSGSQIANALRKAGHRVLLVDAYLGLTDEAYSDNPRQLFLGEEDGRPYTYTIPAVEPDLEALRAAAGNGRALLGRHVLDACRSADIVFLGLHGGMGEDGKIQATLETLGIRYTGSSYDGCLLAMDKDLSKNLMRLAGERTPDWAVVEEGDSPETVRSKTAPIGFPCVVKPCNNGSSIGVSMADGPEAFGAALRDALRLESKVLVERKIEGREFSVGVLGGVALPVIEIIPRQGFYDYANKYQSDGADEICPADLPDDTARTLQESAVHVGRLLRVGDYYRVDYMMGPDGSLYCLEANTLPGMTPTSLIPQEAAAIGITYVDLCDRIVRLAMDRP